MTKQDLPPAPAGELYPCIQPFATGYLAVGEGHEIYYEQSGNPSGKAAVYLHGGPGAGSDPRARQFYDPAAYHVVQFDQRGCGKSRPAASLENNTTWHLIADMERLRDHLDLERWQVAAAHGAVRSRCSTHRRIPSASPS